MVAANLLFTIRCLVCSKDFSISCVENDYKQWKKGEKPIQEALYYLDENQRELLLSSICGKCFDKMFPS
jgi:hypothetical protein